MSSNPAKLFGLYPQKGSLQIGADADLVVFDPMMSQRISPKILHYEIDWNPYTNFQVTGWPITTISRGEILCNNGKFVGRPNGGVFLKREHLNYVKSY
jgi:dihydropyrimidinase